MAGIHKAGGVVIRDRKLLVARAKGKEHFVAPGGKVEAAETPAQALVRELREEYRMQVAERDLEPFGTFYAKAAGNESKEVQMDVFIVKSWTGELAPDSEIEEVQWISSDIPQGMKVGSVFEHEVIPRLREENLID